MAQLKENSTVKVGATGYRILTTADAGSGAGFNADTTDGYHMNQDVRTTASPTFVKVWGAVGNDFADAIEIDNEVPLSYGRVYVRNKEGKTSLSSKYNQKGIIGILTNTQSFTAGVLEENKLPIAVAGFVLAYCKNLYETGTALTCGKEGILQKANLFVKLFFPERIIATFYKDMSSVSDWNNVEVKCRHLVKVK